jgi:hypothetical protein
VAVVVLLGCGSRAVDTPIDCALPANRFVAQYDRFAHVGECEQMKSSKREPLQFSRGQYVPEISGLASCNTTQTGCAIVVLCISSVINARLDFEGTLAEDGRQLDGVATLTGSYGGCSRVDYMVSAFAE